VPFTGTSGRRIYEYIFVPVVGPNGEVEAVAGTTRDVTERTQSEEALRESEERFRVFVSTTSEVIYRMSPDWTEMRQLRGKDFIADTEDPSRGWLNKYIYPEDQANVMAAIHEAIRTKSMFRLEHRVLRVDGTLGWTLSRAIPILNSEGDIVEWFGAAADVTERKRAHEALRGSELALRRQSEQLAAALAASDTGTFRWNPETDEFHELDENLKRLFGRDPAAEFKTMVDIIKLAHPDDVPALLAAIDAGRSGADFSLEFRVVLDDGSVRWLYGRAKMEWENGRPSCMVGACTDITRRKLAEDAAIRSEKLAAVGRLSATMAHEINNPLAAVTNLLYLSNRDTALSPQTRSFLQMAGKELDRVALVARQTLGFSRENTAPTLFNISEVMDELISVYSYRLCHRNVEIDKDFGDCAAQVFGVLGEFRQVFSNLLVNAIDAVADKSGRIRVRVRASRELSNSRRAGVRITVADNGCGIPGSVKVKIFEPFFTTKQEHGTGLGLWLTRSILHKYGASIRVRSRVGPGPSGTVFSVFWPEINVDQVQRQEIA
jgi:two-component system, sporulation sensor kinase E